MLRVGSLLMDRLIMKKAVLIESVVEQGQRRWTESVAMLVSEQVSLLEMWSCCQMQPTVNSPACCRIFVQGEPTCPDVILCPEHGWCVSFLLDQLQLASCSTSVDIAQVFATFDWLDTHMFMPCYALPSAFPVGIFAFQETRLRRLSHGHDARYWLFKSSATKHGHYGVMVGLARIIPLGQVIDAQGKPQKIFIQQRDVAVISTDPRHLILRLRTTLCKCILIAGHAPHSGATSEEISQWWSALAGQIPSKYRTWPRILLVDANARVGSEPCPHIGDHQAERGTGKEEGFEQFVREQGLFLPSTSSHFQEGDGMTWRHSNGSWHRDDFIGLPMTWQYASCRAWVSLDVDVGLVKEDHRVPMVQFSCSMPITTPTRVKHIRKLQTTHVEAAILDAIQRPDWTCDVHTHARQLQEGLVDALYETSLHPVDRPHKIAMSADTWELVCQKRDTRRKLAELNQTQARTEMAAWFACWRHAMVATSHQPLMTAFDELLSHQDRQIAFTYFQFRCLGRKVTAALRADDVSFYGALLQDAAEYLSPMQAKQFWAVVRRSLPRFQQRRMTTPPFQIEGLEDQWVSHFGELEAGIETTFRELAVQCLTRQSRSLFGAPSTVSLTDLPSVIQLEDAFRMTKAGKATGEDPLPSALFHNAAAGLAHLYHDLLLKEFFWQTEPLDCKGGPIAIIPKCLHPSTVKQYRGILLLGNMAKRTHAILRQQIMTFLAPARAPGQLGGFKAQQVCFGSQALRLLCRLADQRGVSSAVLFLDLASAFHYLVRELVTGVSSSANLEKLLIELQRAGNGGEKVKAAAGLPGILADLGAPECLVRLVRDIHAETWCSLPNGQYLHTHRGTRPGSPLADIVFHILMASVAKRIDGWIDQNQIHKDILGGAHDDVLTFIPSVLWADDIAVPLATSEAQNLVPLLQKLLAEVKGYMRELGFTLNFARGKTSAVVSFRGKNAAKLRQQFQLVAMPGIQCFFEDGTEHWLHFVPAYKHLGTVFTSDHGLDLEISCRIGVAKAAFAHLSKPLLTNKHLPLKTRLQLFQALVSTKLFFGLGSWNTPTPKQLQRLSGFWINTLKKVLRLTLERWSMSAAQVVAAADTVGVRARLALDRLLYAQRLFSVGPFFLHHLVHLEFESSPHSWLEGLRADLQWVSDIMPQSLPTGWDHDMTSLFEMWQAGGKEWRALVYRAVRIHKEQEHIIADVHRFHHKIFATLRAVGTEFQPDPCQLVPDECTFTCFCGKCFSTNRGLLAHQRKQHQVFSPERPFLQGATCLHCGRYCWTTQRLQQHLSYIPKKLGYNPCYVALQRQGRSVTYESMTFPHEVLGLARREALQTAGSAVEQVTVVERQREEWSQELERCLSQLEFSILPDDPLQCGAELGDALSCATQTWFERFYPQGPSVAEKQLLPEAWLGAMCDTLEATDLAIDEWVQFAFLAWGDHWLPDIVAHLWMARLSMMWRIFMQTL